MDQPLPVLALLLGAMTSRSRDHRTPPRARTRRWAGVGVGKRTTLALLAGIWVAWASGQPPVSFEELAPILAERCVICHAGPAAPLGLRLDSLEGVLAGSSNGAVIVPGDPEGSELVLRLRGDSLPRMPLTGPPYLSDEQIDLFVRWIAGGAGGTGDAPAADPPANPVAPANEPAAVPSTQAEPPQMTFSQVEGLLLSRCAVCHTSQGLMGSAPEGYRLDSYEEAVRADDRARIVPFAPEASELVRRILGHALPRMPFGGPYLEPAEIDLIVAWISEGAKNAAGTILHLPAGTRLRLHGTWGADGTLDGLSVVVDDRTRLDDTPRPGGYLEVRAFLDEQGRVVAERIGRD